MRNYGEELAYWYLRLNGFFPLADFVVHDHLRSRRGDPYRTYTGDCDLLAVRPPHVSEEVGGQEDDWDPVLFSRLDLSCTLGLVCEVKTGRFADVDILSGEKVEYAVRRLGFFRGTGKAEAALSDGPIYSSTEIRYQVAKLLIADRDAAPSDRYLFVSLGHARAFLRGRVEKYKERKVADRMFFPSTLMQELIWEVGADLGS